MRRLLLAFTLVAFLIPVAADAQGWRHRGNSWNPRGGWNGGYNGWNNGWYGGSYYGGYYSPRGFNLGIYSNNYWPNSYYYGYSYPNVTYYSTPIYYDTPTYYSTPTYSYNVGTSVGIPSSSMYVDVNGNSISSGSVSTPAVSGRQARLEIRLQNPDDELLIEGQVMQGTGLNRSFVSPDLIAGKDYTYTIKSRRPGTTEAGKEETRTLGVKAGSTFTVDFTRLPAPAPVSPHK